MSHPHDPYRPPEAAGRDAAHPTSGDDGPTDSQDHSRSTPPVAAPIVWDRGDDRVDTHPWSAPDPFAEPEPSAASAPSVTKSKVAPPASPPQQSAPSREAEQQPAESSADEPVPVAFADPVPAPPHSAAHPQGDSSYPAPPPAPQDDTDDEALTIGRGRGNSIVLDDMLVSRHHVRITADDDGLVLQDLGSRNGTYVNGQRVQRIPLHEGDRLGIGATTFEVRDGWLVSV